MNKFSRYVGLLFSLSLLVFFIQVPIQYYPKSAKLTPFDGSIIVQLVTSKNDTFKFWNSATHYMNICGTYPYDCKDLSQFIDMKAFFANLSDMIDLYPPLENSRQEIMKFEFKESAAKDKFYEDANKAVPMRLDQIEGSLKFWIYSINLSLLLVVLIGVKFRQKVGNIILSPFKLILKLLGLGAKSAKSIHKKI